MDNPGEVSQLLIGTILFDAVKSHMHVILRTISSFFPHQKILFLSKVMPLKICDTSPGLSIFIEYGILREGSQFSTNLKRESAVSSLLIG